MISDGLCDTDYGLCDKTDAENSALSSQEYIPF